MAASETLKSKKKAQKFLAAVFSKVESSKDWEALIDDFFSPSEAEEASKSSLKASSFNPGREQIIFLMT